MIRADRSNTTDLELEFPSGTISVPYSTIAGVITDPASPEMLAAVRDWIYSQLDSEIRLNQLPQNDPDRSTDPATESMFWRGNGGQRALVSRPYIVSVTWDGERFQYSFRLPV